MTIGKETLCWHEDYKDMLDKTGGQTKSQPQPGWLRKEAVKLEAQSALAGYGLGRLHRAGVTQRRGSTANKTRRLAEV